MKKVILLMAAVVMLTFSSCAPKDKAVINIAAIKGPTGLGIVGLMGKNEKNESTNKYNFSVVAAPDEITAKILSGELDMAAVPTNLGSVLYNKTEGGVVFLAINTLGVLYVLDNGNGINSVADLEGKTIYSSGQGSVPEYALNYILAQNGLVESENVFVEYLSEHSELAAKMISGDVTLGLLPEPHVTSVIAKNPDVKVALDLTEEWAGVSDSSLAMGGIIVRKDFLENNKQAVLDFLNEYKASVEYVVNNPESSAELSEKYDVMSTAVAKAAIPNCNIVYIEKQEMKTILEGFYDVLFNANPKSLGGSMPGEDFYFIGN